MKPAKLDGTLFTHNLSGSDLKEVRARIKAAHLRFKTLKRDLFNAVETHDLEGQKLAIDRLLSDPEAKLAAVITANRQLPARKRQSIEQCLAAPTALNFYEPLKEFVWFDPKPKSFGGVRMIANPGPQHRTAQVITQAIVGTYLKPRPFQFTWEGVPKAIDRIKQAILSGHVHVARLDIKEFYSSFTHEKLMPELPLPMGVVRNTVLGRWLTKVKIGKSYGKKAHHGYLSPASPPLSLKSLHTLARRGLPQGFGSSSAVAMFIMSRLSWANTEGVVLVNYEDDFLVLALTAELRDAAVDALSEAVGHLPGGIFELVKKQTSTASDGFEFLDHSIWIGSDLVVNPTERNVARFSATLCKLEHETWSKFLLSPNKSFMLSRLAKQYAYVVGWSKAFAACQETIELRADAMGHIEDDAKSVGLSLADVKAAIDESMTYSPNGSSLSSD